MREETCPGCGHENKPDDYEGRPLRVLIGEITHQKTWTCIHCSWEIKLSWWNSWWYEKYEKDFRKRSGGDLRHQDR